MLIQNLFRTLKPFHKRMKKDILCTNKALEWGKITFKLLGIDFDTELQNIFDICDFKG